MGHLLNLLRMKNTSFSERLNTALDKAGFPPKNKGRIQLLAEMVGLSHRGVSKWINGESCPPAKKYKSLAKKLNVRENWLKLGEPPMLLDDKKSCPSEDVSKRVSVFDINHFSSFNQNAIDTITCNLPYDGVLFGIKLESEAMSPRFPKGSIIIFDDKKKPKDGDFVLVSYDSYPAPIFRQLFIIGSCFYLNAHNPKFDRLILEDKSKIHGTMVQAILSFV